MNDLTTAQLLQLADALGRMVQDIVLQGRLGGRSVDPRAYPPPQYGEGIQAALSWLRSETTAPPTNQNGLSPYSADHHPLSST
jgi:hypothetical protein